MTGRPKSDPDAQWWTAIDIAAYLGVQPKTIATYHQRKQIPEPDDRIGRSWIWEPARIIEWSKNRPRTGNHPAQGDLNKVDPDAEWWTIVDLAAYLGVKTATINTYRYRGTLPAPDAHVGQSPIWKPARIIEWHNLPKRQRRPSKKSDHPNP